MIEAAFWLAAACALAGALCGNRTAWLLLASAAMCIVMDAQGIEFNFIFWLLIDLVVILGIIRPHMTNSDVVILALFIPAWTFYLVPDPARFAGSSLVVIAQLALTFPAGRVKEALVRWRAPLKDEGRFDRMAVA